MRRAFLVSVVSVCIAFAFLEKAHPQAIAGPLPPALPLAFETLGPVRFSFEKLTLPNGLVVVLNEDHRAPAVGLELGFRVGAAQDPPGRHGMARLLRELILHPTTRHLRYEDQRGLFSTLGVSRFRTEGLHGLDQTALHTTVPASALELALWLESDRLGFVTDGMDAAEVSRARDEAEEEQTKDDALPLSGVAVELERRIFAPGATYGNLARGPLELGNVTAPEAQARFRAAYGPSNAVLTIAGDFDTKAVRELVTRYFAPIVSGPRPAEGPPPRAAFDGDRRLQLEAGIDAPCVVLAWPTPPYLREDDALLDEVGTILARRLRERRMTPKGLASASFAYEASFKRASVFFASVPLQAGHPMSEGIGAIDAVLGELSTVGPSAAEVDGARLTMLGSTFKKFDVPQNRAMFFGAAERDTGDPNCILPYETAYVAATPDAIRRVTSTYLTSEHRFVAEVAAVPTAPRAGRLVRGGRP